MESLKIDDKEIKKKLSENNVSNKFKFEKSEDIDYLLSKSLYKKQNVPTINSEKISFYLSNIYECQITIKKILSYLLKKLEIISNELDGYLQKKSNSMFRLFNDFIGYCINLSQIIRDYDSFYKLFDEFVIENEEIKIRILSYKLNISSTSDMLENITNILLTHKAFSDCSYNFALIRPYLEYMLSENLRIKLKHIFKENGLIQDHGIIFTEKMKFEDYFNILKDMNLLDSNTCDTNNNIYCWGNRSLHNSQMVPIHKIWICLFYIFDQIGEAICKPVQITYELTNKIYNNLSKSKLKIIEGRFISSFYDIYS